MHLNLPLSPTLPIVYVNLVDEQGHQFPGCLLVTGFRVGPQVERRSYYAVRIIDEQPGLLRRFVDLCDLVLEELLPGFQFSQIPHQRFHVGVMASLQLDCFRDVPDAPVDVFQALRQCLFSFFSLGQVGPAVPGDVFDELSEGRLRQNGAQQPVGDLLHQRVQAHTAAAARVGPLVLLPGAPQDDVSSLPGPGDNQVAIPSQHLARTAFCLAAQGVGAGVARCWSRHHRPQFDVFLQLLMLFLRDRGLMGVVPVGDLHGFLPSRELGLVLLAPEGVAGIVLILEDVAD